MKMYPNNSNVVVHLTSVHPRYDTRIFVKQCISLAHAGFQTHLVVADGKGNELKNNIHIYDVGASRGRLDRIRNAPKKILEKALELDGDIYHLHDPELLSIGLKLKQYGKKVIFDAHEDIPKQILGKPYLNKPTKYLLSNFFKIYEQWICKKIDIVVAATPYIRDKYLNLGIKAIDVNNFPSLDELGIPEIKWETKENYVCYIGAISEIRGILEMVQAMDKVSTNVRLQLGGIFNEENFEKKVKKEKGWEKIDELGWVNRNEILNTLKSSIAGIVTLHPTVNYLDSLPVKMFEYMCAGIPVIASNFPLWKSIIENNNCGLCVDPNNPSEIANAIDFLVSHPIEAEKMGINGQNAVKRNYNWAYEEKKLLKIYYEI